MRIKKEIRKIRIAEEEIDTSVYATCNNERIYTPYKDMPYYYVIYVQVKVCGSWVTIWKASVDMCDGDGRTIVQARANEIVELIEKSL